MCYLENPSGIGLIEGVCYLEKPAGIGLRFDKYTYCLHKTLTVGHFLKF